MSNKQEIRKLAEEIKQIKAQLKSGKYIRKEKVRGLTIELDSMGWTTPAKEKKFLAEYIYEMWREHDEVIEQVGYDNDLDNIKVRKIDVKPDKRDGGFSGDAVFDATIYYYQ